MFLVEPVKRITEKGKSYIPDDEIIGCGGNTPYIAAISKNNGITGYSDRDANNKGDCITLSTTAASPDTVFYQPDDFIGRQQMSSIRRIDGKPLGLHCGLYIIPFFKLATRTFNYSNKLTNNHLKNIQLELSVTPHPDSSHVYSVDDIDWQYMQDTIKELEQDTIKELEQDTIKELDTYLNVTGLDDYELTDDDKKVLSFSRGEGCNQDGSLEDDKSDEIVRYGEFRVGDLFEIKPTKSYKYSNLDLYKTSGNTPVLSNSSLNNGLGGYCGLEPTEEGFIVTFSDTTTGADTMFYQDRSFIGYSHVQGLYPFKPELWNSIRYFYLISSIRRAAGDGWSYSVKFNRKLVSNLKIELPITSSGDIDFDYMESYIKAIQKLVIVDVVKYKDSLIEATKKVVSSSF